METNGKHILIVHCAEGPKKALQKMANRGIHLSPGVATFEISCTGRLSESMIMGFLEDGFSGVLVVGCHRDNCRYLDGNRRAEIRIGRIKRLLDDAEIPDRKVDIAFFGPDEASKLADTIHSFEEKFSVEGQVAK